jgi:enterochelin esterase-like enzyme
VTGPDRPVGGERPDGPGDRDGSDLDQLLQQFRHDPDLHGTGAVRAARLLLDHGALEDLPRAAELAWRAHEEGEADAGRLFATAVDRYSVARSRQQRFGTFAFPYRGELVPAPLDGSVTDELRAELGLGSLVELQAEIDEANRQAARRRVSEGPVDRGQGYVRVWHDLGEDDLRARWAAEGRPVWADGDEVTFVCDRPYAGAIVGPLFEIPMWRVGELLVLSVKVHRLAEAVFTYGFWPLDESGRPAFTERPEPDGRWRGPEAPAAAPTNDILVGTLEEHTVPSTALGRPRRVTVYRPAGHTPQERLPVVYATDGQWFAAYARRLDAAIESTSIPRCVVVAGHAGSGRTGEYFPGYDPAAFSRHEHFFVDELMPWAEETLGVATGREHRAVFGCSDGGAHALTIGLAHPDRFGHVIAYSSGLPPSGNERWADSDAPYIQLCAGVLEGNFHTATYAWHAFLDMTGVGHHWTERVCGHELIQWIEEFPAAVGRAFG